MIQYPVAKINLGLNITEKRADGYHNLETVFYPINIQDSLSISVHKETHLFITGNAIDCNEQDNIVVKAYNLMAQDFELPPLAIRLHKQIPSGAGMGGGSSDAAAMINLLNRRFGLRLTSVARQRYASALGADCAFFIESKPAFATGIGNILQPVSFSLAGFTIVIIKPAVSINTAQAYSHITPHKSEYSPLQIVQRPLYEWKDKLVNDFEEFAFEQYPILADIKQRLYDAGAVYASMTGSGSAIYGIFNKKNVNIQEQFPGLYYKERELF
ncbi:MAG: 4-(cytidine 5'-diphospho)-2-C-methyl-D-erythritol kinase [Bacteroidaceae bacterium]|nr:4-(cytidine 5'-diphospho)-2-C-methyl-D-erythritol kinase [Bacteroidaceae bacterium]